MALEMVCSASEKRSACTVAGDSNNNIYIYITMIIMSRIILATVIIALITRITIIIAMIITRIITIIIRKTR